jgi:hypothetical protein
MNPRLPFLVVSFLTFLTIGSIAAISLSPPPSRADANCGSCHSSYYLRVEITDFSAPNEILKGGTNQSTVSVRVSGSGTSSIRDAFSMTVRIVSVNSKVTASSQQSNTNQCPSGSSAPYTWTRTYTFSLTGASVGAETLRAEAVMDPNHESPAVKQTSTRTADVYTVNSAPSLSAGSVSPVSGDTKTGLTYKVTYTDADGTAPTYVRTIIDGTDTRALSPADGIADSIPTGEEYSLSGVLLGAGNHTYRFEASDGTISAAFPVPGELNGPSIVIANSAPVLSEGTVAPGSGAPGENYTYTVVYSDPENDPPSGGVELRIDDGAPVLMEADPSAASYLKDGDFSNGERYQHVRNMSEGAHNYSFKASDGSLEMVLGPLSGPIVSLTPVLFVAILEPTDGSIFYSDEDIVFTGSASSNREANDLEFTWISSVMGVLSQQVNFTSRLTMGNHTIILNVTSPSLVLSREAMVSILVIERPIEVPDFVIVAYYPTADPTINETDQVKFVVNYTIRTGTASLVWYLDGDRAAIFDTYDLVTDHYSAGEHHVKAGLLLNGSEVWNRTWTVDVIDIPADIYLSDENWDVGGPFWSGDEISIDIPAADELGRDLTAKWYIDVIPLTVTGRNFSFMALERPFGSPGSHAGTAVFTNPDGTTFEVDFDYEVRYHDPDGDDPLLPEEEGGRPGIGSFSDNPLGYLILIIGAIAMIGGAFKMTVTLLPEGSIQRLLPDAEELPWEE